MIKNTKDHFGSVAKLLHWTTALIFLALLSLGFYMTSIEVSPLKVQLFGLHKSFGFLVLFMLAARLVWRLINALPEHIPGHAVWERVLSKIIHVLLYFGLLVMPMSGWMMSSAADFPAAFFGYEMPDLINKDDQSAELMRHAHGYGALILIAALTLHAVGAIKHHFIDRDITLKRMTSDKLGSIGGVCLAIVACISLLAPSVQLILQQIHRNHNQDDLTQYKTIAEGPVELLKKAETGGGITAQAWLIDTDSSHINFRATQYGTAFDGGFDRFDGHLFFDPNDLGNSKVDIFVDISSIKTGSDDRDSQALDPEWFDANQFPVARFETKGFTSVASHHYEATANLTLRDITQTIVLPFTIEFSDDGQKMKVRSEHQLSLNRHDFKVGRGTWSTGDTIGAVVSIAIDVTAERQ
jgi:cytochrome b561/polyisoprenoid-binding protein YceI|tara:strand:+ start:816 stop:2048 length:1233 start_codon:yes stop_codon:yes gene_type:complete